VAAQAVERLVPPPTVTKPHQDLATLTRLAGRLAACGAILAGPIPAIVAAGTIPTLVPEAPDEFVISNLRVGVYT
jgi:hypothetical protein